MTTRWVVKIKKILISLLLGNKDFLGRGDPTSWSAITGVKFGFDLLEIFSLEDDITALVFPQITHKKNFPLYIFR